MSLSEPGSPSPAVLPPGLISFIRLLVLSEPDFANAHSKEKLPKGNLKKTDVKDNHPVLKILDEVINQREGMYVGGNVEVCSSLKYNECQSTLVHLHVFARMMNPYFQAPNHSPNLSDML